MEIDTIPHETAVLLVKANEASGQTVLTEMVDRILLYKEHHQEPLGRAFGYVGTLQRDYGVSIMGAHIGSMEG